MFIIYALIRSLPSSFAETMAMQLAQAPGAKPYEEWLAQLNASYGLDLDIVPGFFTWLSKAVVGNFGDSWKWNVPATQKFTEVIGLSVIMGGISFVLSIVIAVPLGVLAATKQYSRADYVITSVALVGISLPTFFFATLLKLFFSVKLGWFDLYGLVGRDYGTYFRRLKFASISTPQGIFALSLSNCFISLTMDLRSSLSVTALSFNTARLLPYSNFTLSGLSALSLPLLNFWMYSRI